MLHAANLTVIVFILLPLVAVLIASIRSEKSLQADTRRGPAAGSPSTTSPSS